MDIPTLFTDKETLKQFNFDEIQSLLGTEIDHHTHIPHLSVPDPDNTLCRDYFKSSMMGQNHVFIEELMDAHRTKSNISLPLLHQWHSNATANNPRIDNLVIINDPLDAERLCKDHIQKTPIFKSFLYNSIISTTDNDDWKQQRDDMNIAFLPSLSLRKVFPISKARATKCVDILCSMSANYAQPVNMSEFFLHEAQAQLQLGMFGFSDEFERRTNKRIRDAFSGIDIGYTDQFSCEALVETRSSEGPLSKLFSNDSKYLQNKGNMLIFAFAGHDTTGHTLTWLVYELCKHPSYKEEFIQEIDRYWSNHPEPTYESFHELPFMTKCLTETLRLWPAIPNGTFRELEHDETIKGLDGTDVVIPQGTYCQIMNWIRHRNEELWGKDVKVFNPHREFNGSEIWSHKGFGTTNVSSERYSPFTYGPRNCIGKNFSHMEMRIILLNLFKEHDFRMTYEQSLASIHKRYQGLNTFTMGPQDIHDTGKIGMYMSVLPRRQSKL
jgi:hypothetical protein